MSRKHRKKKKLNKKIKQKETIMSYSNDKDFSNTFKYPEPPESFLDAFLPIANTQSSSNNEKRMLCLIVSYLNKIDCSWEIDSIGNLLVTKGEADIYPCVVSHMDTVHQIVDNFYVDYFIDEKDKHVLAYANTDKAAIGGDDKCGIYSCLHMLSKLDNIKLVFFTQEESGLIGSSRIEHDFFNDCGYIIQLDRWGCKDFICQDWQSKTVSDEFLFTVTDDLIEFGYKETDGLITDSINLFNDNIGISCINVSCGYYQHHSKFEYIDMNHFYNSILFLEKIVESLGEKRYESEPSYSNYYSKYRVGYDNFHDRFSDIDDVDTDAVDYPMEDGIENGLDIKPDDGEEYPGYQPECPYCNNICHEISKDKLGFGEYEAYKYYELNPKYPRYYYCSECASSFISEQMQWIAAETIDEEIEEEII